MPKDEKPPVNRIALGDQAMQWVSRTIAVLIFMVGPGWLGVVGDRRWGTSFLGPTGFALGMVLATTALLILVRRLIPPAGGLPLPLDEPRDGDAEGEDA